MEIKVWGAWSVLPRTSNSWIHKSKNENFEEVRWNSERIRWGSDVLRRQNPSKQRKAFRKYVTSRQNSGKLCRPLPIFLLACAHRPFRAKDSSHALIAAWLLCLWHIHLPSHIPGRPRWSLEPSTSSFAYLQIKNAWRARHVRSRHPLKHLEKFERMVPQDRGNLLFQNTPCRSPVNTTVLITPDAILSPFFDSCLCVPVFLPISLLFKDEMLCFFVSAGDITDTNLRLQVFYKQFLLWAFVHLHTYNYGPVISIRLSVRAFVLFFSHRADLDQF